MPFGVVSANERVKKSALPLLSWPGLTRPGGHDDEGKTQYEVG
jgi:hypothetical protein